MDANWTPEDEAGFQELHRRRNEIMSARKYKVIQVVTRLVSISKFREETVDRIADIFINNADDIRDALQPYDSGVRVKEVAVEPTIGLHAMLRNLPTGVIHQSE